MFKLNQIKLFITQAFSRSFYFTAKKPVDEYKVIAAGNIMVAQGYKCSKCKVIRAYNQTVCNCH